MVVEAVQYPAWLERGGQAVPLVPGVELQGADSLRTGANARARLRLSDGSTVKLGENARFELERAQDVGFLRASLRVVGGAFRYTTDKLRLSARRSVTIRAHKRDGRDPRHRPVGQVDRGEGDRLPHRGGGHGGLPKEIRR